MTYPKYQNAAAPEVRGEIQWEARRSSVNESMQRRWRKKEASGGVRSRRRAPEDTMSNRPIGPEAQSVFHNVASDLRCAPVNRSVRRLDAA
jgi:hypothetical protein